MNEQIGTNSRDTIRGTDEGDFLAGEGGNDRMFGGDGDDIMLGGGGDDVMHGQGGDDIMFGNSSAGGPVDMSKFRIAQDVDAKVTFQGESAGFKNTLGVYKIGADGTIYDVQVLFANASLKGSGGDLIGGQSGVDLGLKAGETLGFFIVPNGYAQRGMANVLNSEGKFSFVDKDGNPANINSGPGLKLVMTDANGRETTVRSQYGTEVFHSNASLNADGVDHVKTTVDTQSGQVRIGFEDLWNGGDKDYDDSVFTIDLGVINAALLPRPSTGDGSSSDNDTMRGGDGDDIMFGMRGDDLMIGGNGNDQIWGNSGNDDIRGGAGDDQLYGGQGDDVIRGGSGNDYIEGNSGDDVLFGGSGDDVIKGGSGNDVIHGGSGDDELHGGSGDDVINGGSGNDRIFGGSGNDTFIGSSGNDYYVGGAGFDTLDYSNARRGMDIDMSKGTASGMGRDTFTGVEAVIGSSHNDVIKGDKRDNVIDGGDGNDVIRSMGGADTLTGGAGSDRFVFLTKDVIGADGHLGVDTITDFTIGEDILDLSGMIAGSPRSLDDLVLFTETDSGTMVSVLIAGEMVEVVQLDGIFGANANDLLADGAILA